MITLSDEKQQEFRRLSIIVRKTASDIEKLPQTPSTFRGALRETCINLYGWTEKFVKDFPEMELEFNLLPKEPGRGHPDVFEGQIKALKNFLDSIEDTLTFQDKDKVAKEFLILPGQAFTAKKKIGTILQESKKFIKIVDNYLSDDSIEMLETTNRKRNIFILTKKRNKKFITAIKRMKKGWQGKIEVRISTKFHDRYLIIDDRTVWHCGPSPDYLGINKPGVISKLEDNEIIKKIVEIFDKEQTLGSNIL